MPEQPVNSNAYFEQQVANFYSQLPEDQVVGRIKECEDIVSRLTHDPIWQTVLKDAGQWVQRLDSNWQEIRDKQQLNAARVLKFAYMHITELPIKYSQDLKVARQELARRKNVDTKIEKDYDLETNIK